MKMFLMLALTVTIVAKANATVHYTINSNRTWSSLITGSCNDCTFSIAPHVTFTIDVKTSCVSCLIMDGTLATSDSFTCENCSFNGTNILAINSLVTSNGKNSFVNTTFNSAGTGGLLITGDINISNSTFNFTDNTAFLHTAGALSVTNSNLYFYDSAFFTGDESINAINKG